MKLLLAALSADLTSCLSRVVSIAIEAHVRALSLEFLQLLRVEGRTPIVGVLPHCGSGSTPTLCEYTS